MPFLNVELSKVCLNKTKKIDLFFFRYIAEIFYSKIETWQTISLIEDQLLVLSARA